MGNQDFLSAFKRKTAFGGETPGKAEHFLFRIFFDENGLAKVNTVNPNGEPVQPRGRVSNPAIASALSMFSGSDTDFLGWGVAHTTLTLADVPQLTFMLMQCDNVVDSELRPVSYDPTILRPVLSLDEEGSTIAPHFRAEVDSELTDIRFLTDSLVLAGTTMYPVKPVGENFRYSASLLAPFDASMAESYLSVVLSSLSNLKVKYGKRKTVEYRDHQEKQQPGLLFEKVDFDKALFLRVISVLPGLPPDLSADFDITTIATVTDDSVFLRKVESISPEEAIDNFRTLLHSSLKSKKDVNAIYEEGSLFVLPQAQAGTFLLKMLPTLVREYVILGAEKLREFKVQAPVPKLNVRLSSGIDFLEGDVTVELGEQTFTLGDLLKQYHKNKYVELSDGTRSIIEDSYIKRLERIFRQKEDDPDKVEVSFFDIPALENLMDGSELPAFSHSREFYEGLAKLKNKKLKKPEIKGELRPYQAEGTKWMEYLGENNLGGCLADDMGLGKTIQTIALLAKVCPATELPTLIVMPRSLLFNWKAEIERFAPQLTAAVYHGPDRNIAEAVKSKIILTTYAMVRNDIALFKDIDFEYVILDESQNIKNLAAQSTRAVMTLKSKHRLALSGTPMENNLQELYSLFRFLNPGMFGTLEDFNSQYAVPIQHLGDREALETLRKKIFPYILRRLKGDVLQDLPERVDQTMYVEMDAEHRAFYERRRQYYQELVRTTIAAEGIRKSQFVMFQALSELRRIASVPESLSEGRIRSPKLELLVDQVAQSVANGHKTVVFFNFIAGLELAAEQLEKLGIDVEVMTGATTKREAIVRKFQSDPECMVLLMTMKVGGVGLNLTAADTVYIFEPWWNKAAEEQAINRLHRIGQKATVFSYSLITNDTIEEKIQKLQEQKTELFNDLISSDTASAKILTEEDIDFILG